VQSVNVMLDRFLAPTPVWRTNLIGYSVGAAIAVLAATQTVDVATIQTIASNLDGYTTPSPCPNR
jgi:hypothetical protein